MSTGGVCLAAMADGLIRKLFESRKGGYTIYQFSIGGDALLLLDRYARGLDEGRRVRRGDVIAFVGTSGNADASGPHLHFAVTRLDADK